MKGKPALVPMSYEGLNDGEVEIVLGNKENNNKNYYVDSEFKSNNEAKENFFEQKN